MFPEHPEIARTLRTGYPHSCQALFCTDCGRELTDAVYISDGDTVCEGCTRDQILDNHDTAELAAAFGIQRTTVNDYLNS